MDEGGCTLRSRSADMPRTVQRLCLGDRSPDLGVTEPAEAQADNAIIHSGGSAVHLLITSNSDINNTINPFNMPIDTHDEQEKIVIEKPLTQIIETPAHSPRKPWMDYRSVTDEASVQYELLSRAYHADNGLLYVDGHLAVAIGSGYGPVGTRYEMDIGGTTYKVIKADAKNDAHTLNGEGFLGTDGHLIEMIVDTDLLDVDAMYTGDCDCLVPGTVTEIRRIEE